MIPLLFFSEFISGFFVDFAGFLGFLWMRFYFGRGQEKW